MRVGYAGEDKGFFSSSTSYEVIMDYPIDIGQVLRTSLLCAMALLPHTLRWFSRRWAMDDHRNVSQRTNVSAKPAPRTRLEDLPRVSTCPKCRYTRKPEDYAPAWQCPSCKVAYNKVSN